MLSYVFSVAPLSVLVILTGLRSGFRPGLVAADPAQPWQLGFQTPASPLREGIVAFHDDLRRFLTESFSELGISLLLAFVLLVTVQTVQLSVWFTLLP